MVLASVLVLLASLTGCDAPEPAAAPTHTAPTAPPEPVPPPVERLAEAQACDPEALLDRPSEAVPVLDPADACAMPEQTSRDYAADGPKSVVQLQPWRATRDLGEGRTLVDLHPRFHRSLLLTVGDRTWHLENRQPDALLVDLPGSDAEGLAILHMGHGEVVRCAPWEGSPSELEAATESGRPYVSICDDHLLVRNTVRGRRSTLEWATDFVRTRVAGGEHLATLVKKTTHDRYRKAAAIEDGAATADDATGPLPLRLTSEADGATIDRKDLGLPVDTPAKAPAGHWLPVREHPGVWTALLAPRLIALPEDPTNRERVGALDRKEAGALVMLLGFDLDRHDLELEVGTEHPGVEWSPRTPADQRPEELPGPDGFDTLEPLARAGQVPPLEALRLVASFTGGFKREHAAFRRGALAERNHASHYGMVQDGVIHSKLQPGLATLVVWDGGEVEVLTWAEEHEAELDRVLHARQNGVPLLREVAGEARVGELVDSWREGNWSGSATGESRTIRAGACVQESDRGRFLVYGYFTAATPRTMARTFLAAGCTDAIHLDMNALEHTYAAVYERDPEGAWTVHHLDRGMAVLDKARKGVTLPRFVAFADNRDFFTLVRK